MSLILDALARAQREKEARPGPGPDSPAEQPPTPERLRRNRMLAGLGFLGALLLGGALGSVLLRPPASIPGEGRTIAAPQASGSASTPEPASTRIPATTGSERASQGSATAPASAALSPGVESTERPSGVPPARDLPSAPVADADAIAALYADAERPEDDAAVDAEQIPEEPGATVAGAGGSAEEAIDIERVLRRVEVETAAARLEPNPVPLLENLSKQFRDRVPTLMYLRHDYNPGGESTVFLNGELLRVGQRSRGVELREVLPDSAILRFEGTDFRLRALNSWVNL